MIMRNKTKRSVTGIFSLLLTVFGVLFFMACDRTPEKRGWDYFPDMHYSPAYDTYSENPNFPDQKTMQKPVEGTIPMDMIPFQYEKTEEDMDRAGRELFNPFSPDTEKLARGEKAFMAFCSQCHGEKGDGQGVLYTSGRYLVPPTSLIEEEVRQSPDGSIYHTISAGYGVMGEHASIIRSDDRWKIILYIREVLQKAPQEE